MSGDVTALAAVLDSSPLLCPHGSPDFCGVCIAKHVLASSWLAQHDARVRAEALREAADGWAGGEWKDVNFNRAGRDEPPWARQARWLRERADQIDGAR